MAAPRGAIRNWSEYLLFLALSGLARLAPAAVLLGFVRGLSWLAAWLLRGRRRLTAERIQSCLGLRPGDPRVDALIRAAFATIGFNGVEPMLVERRLDAGQSPHELLSIEGGEHLERAFASGKGVLICSAHFGAWEVVPIFLARLYTPIWAMARPFGNPLIERRMLERRLRCVRGSVSKDGGALKVARLMRAGEPLGLLLDQNAGSKGVIMDFMGLPSSHHTVSGVMAQRFGAVVLPLYLLREPGLLRFRLVVEPPIVADPRLSVEEAELDVVRRVSRSLEAMVRAHPEQWLWLHDRWRHALYVQSQRGRGVEAPRTEHTQVPVVQGTNGV